MNVLVVGGGGREHAIVKSIKKNKKVNKIFVLPGNGGISNDAICVNIGATEIDKIVNFAIENSINFAIVAPDDPLVLGCVDALEERNIPCFGPRKNAAIIEGSKAFSKELMKKYNIPTASYEIFSDYEKAKNYIANIDAPIVVKADGLALGKGVLICQTKEEAFDAIKSIMLDKVFGSSGNSVVIEEFLEGPEISVLSFTDGNVVVPMVSSMDHKRIGDNDTGLNTGGMGTIAPNPVYTKEVQQECYDKIFLPTITALKNEGRPFKGCLYFGLMLTKNGPKVIEYNCRFGDPETQVVLPLLKTDLLDVMMAVSEERLADIKVEFLDSYACCVIMASKGYPTKYEKGYKITIDNDIDAEVYVAGAKLEDGNLLTNGGRVLGVTYVSDSLDSAISGAYKQVEKVHFDNAYYRKDIGQRALKIKGSK